MIVLEGLITEYRAELAQLLDEDIQLQETETLVTKRRAEIKERVKDIGSKVGNDQERCIMPVGEQGAWDRRVSFKGGGLDLLKLEKVLGVDKYRKVVCNKTVLYVPSQDKINLARQEGKITEKQLQQCTVDGSPSYSLFKMNGKQLAKAMEDM